MAFHYRSPLRVGDSVLRLSPESGSDLSVHLFLADEHANQGIDETADRLGAASPFVEIRLRRMLLKDHTICGRSTPALLEIGSSRQQAPSAQPLSTLDETAVAAIAISW